MVSLCRWLGVKCFFCVCSSSIWQVAFFGGHFQLDDEIYVAKTCATMALHSVRTLGDNCVEHEQYDANSIRNIMSFGWMTLSSQTRLWLQSLFGWLEYQSEPGHGGSKVTPFCSPLLEPTRNPLKNREVQSSSKTRMRPFHFRQIAIGRLFGSRSSESERAGPVPVRPRLPRASRLINKQISRGAGRNHETTSSRPSKRRAGGRCMHLMLRLRSISYCAKAMGTYICMIQLGLGCSHHQARV